MGVKRSGPEDVYFTIRLPADLHDRLKRTAKKNERSKSAEARQALREHLDRIGRA
jgi:predicted transcriptional regulator